MQYICCALQFLCSTVYCGEECCAAYSSHRLPSDLAKARNAKVTGSVVVNCVGVKWSVVQCSEVQ